MLTRVNNNIPNYILCCGDIVSLSSKSMNTRLKVVALGIYTTNILLPLRGALLEGKVCALCVVSRRG